MKLKFAILLLGLLLQFSFSNGQPYIGKWTHVNQKNEKVIIEFQKNSGYKLSILKHNIGPIERTNGVNKETSLRYIIDSSTKPYKIDVVSSWSGTIIRGIIEFIDDNTIQMQINPIPGGDRPEKFTPDSENYIKAVRTFESSELENI